MGLNNTNNGSSRKVIKFISDKLSTNEEENKNRKLGFYDLKSKKINATSISGDIINIFIRGYMWNGDEKFSLIVSILDGNPETGEENVYDLQISEGCLLYYSLCNSLFSLQSPMGVDVGYYIKNDYLNATVWQQKPEHSNINWGNWDERQSKAVPIRWFLQQSEIPAVKKVQVGNKSVDDDSEKIAFFRHHLGVLCKRLFGTPLLIQRAEGGTEQKPAAPAPAQPPPTTPPTTTSELSQAQFDSLIKKLSSCSDTTSIEKIFTDFYKWMLDKKLKISEIQIQAAKDRINGILRSQGMELDPATNWNTGVILFVYNDLPF
jgi:hypothetical protein